MYGIVAFGFIIGSILGSFAKALADRSLDSRSFFGRSYCEKCQHTLSWYDLFPIFSYLQLKGKCRYCSTKLKIEYLLVEVATGLLVALLFSFSFLEIPIFENSAQLILFYSTLILNVLFITVLVMVTITDIKEMLIPDRIIIPAILIGLISLLVLALFKIGYLYYNLTQNPIGHLLLPPNGDYFYRHAWLYMQEFLGAMFAGLAIGGFFLLLIIITKGRGMGGGDVKLGAFMGLGLGFPYSFMAVFLSFLTGAIFSIFLILFKKKHFGQAIPFGPFLVLGSLLTLFWGKEIAGLYMKVVF